MGYCRIYAWHLCIKGMQSVQAATYWHSNVHVEICLYNPLQRHIRCWYNAKCFQLRSSIERNWYDRALVINCVYLHRSIFPRMRHKCLGTKGSANIRTYVAERSNYEDRMNIVWVETYSRAYILVKCVSQPQRSPTNFRSAELMEFADFSWRRRSMWTLLEVTILIINDQMRLLNCSYALFTLI